MSFSLTLAPFLIANKESLCIHKSVENGCQPSGLAFPVDDFEAAALRNRDAEPPHDPKPVCRFYPGNNGSGVIGMNDRPAFEFPDPGACLAFGRDGQNGFSGSQILENFPGDDAFARIRGPQP